MADADAGSRRLDGYLGELRARLGRLPDREAAEIVEELRSHVRDSLPGGALTEEGVAAALARLGSPDELAALYAAESLLARAGRSRSPWLLFSSLFRWATMSVAGFFAFLGLLVGYALAASFLCAALMKPFAPRRVGLWLRDADTFSLHLGFADGSRPGQELLGFWIVPLGLALGAGLGWLTTRFGRWCIGRFRRRPLLVR
jgi:hypothetical protein